MDNKELKQQEEQGEEKAAGSSTSSNIPVVVSSEPAGNENVENAPQDGDSSMMKRVRENPFFFNFSSSSSAGYVPVPDETDDIMSSIMLNNPATFTPSFRKGERPRYFKGSMKPRDSRDFDRRQRVTAASFVNFLRPGDGDQEDFQEDEPMPAVQQEGQGYIQRVGSKGKKRSFEDIGEETEIAAKKIKISAERPATAVLNELTPGLNFSYEDLKVDVRAEPKFLCRISYPPANQGIESIEYVGEGRSKKLAKLNVSEKILAHLGIQDVKMQDLSNIPTIPESINEPPAPSLQAAIAQSMAEYTQALPPPIDFTSDDAAPSYFSTSPPMPLDLSMLIKRLQKVPNLEDNVVNAIHILLGPEGVEYEEVADEGPPHDKVFTLNLLVKSNGQTYEGRAKTKKKAKSNAAKSALMGILTPRVYQCLVAQSANALKKPSSQKNQVPAQHTTSISEDLPPAECFNEDPNVLEYDSMFSDYVCRLVNDKYEEIMENHQDHIAQKVLAGIVMTRTIPMLENGEVVVVTTGTKCIEGDCMSTDGLAVNDCHAEILATRGFRDFIYSQIELLEYATTDEEKEECIFEELSPNDDQSGNRLLKLKKDMRFHLYISTSPCGDARIFSPRGLETEADIETMDELQDDGRSKKNRGVLRAKVEAGEGTIPVSNLITGPQTWDSIIQGNALYTMSCSDKVCNWNVVGVQGALLSNLIQPIYYASITLGSLHHPVHFTRAVTGRIEALGGKIPLPFKINRSHLLMISHQEKRRVKKSPNHAVCWRHGWSTAEILAASKGRCEPGGVVSRLSKRMAFIRFLKLYKNKSGRRENFADLSYREAKMMAVEYQAAKEIFRSHMKETDLGSWISKPVEMDSFYIGR